MSTEFKCTRCGHCCRDVDTADLVSQDDLMRWTSEGRKDILDRRDSSGRLWYDPHTKPLGCPFLVQKADGLMLCAIHETKPLKCQRFPEVVVEGLQLVKVTRWAAQKCPGVAQLSEELAIVQSQSPC